MTFKTKSDATVTVAPPKIRPSPISPQDALVAVDTFFNNPTQLLTEFKQNASGGLTFLFQDTHLNVRTVVLNRAALLSVLSYGLDAISKIGDKS
ncbi:MAG: hypothetical protein ACREQ5_12820 [Candidatus Dormibacteria bacterium]